MARPGASTYLHRKRSAQISSPPERTREVPDDLAQGLRAGDQLAFEAVYREHLESVMRLLRGGFGYTSGGERRFCRVESAFDAEELCQEAFAAFFRQCINGNFDPTRPAGPYLHRIATNLALRRRGKAARELPHAEPEPAPADLEDPVIRSETVALVEAFRGELDEPQREVLRLYFEAKRSQRDVGEALGMSRDQVYRAIVKLRERARAFFGKRGWFDEP